MVVGFVLPHCLVCMSSSLQSVTNQTMLAGCRQLLTLRLLTSGVWFLHTRLTGTTWVNRTREQAFISEAAPYLIPTYVQCSEYAIPAADDRWSSPEQQPRSLLSPQPPQCLLSPSADLIASTYCCNCTDYQYKRVKVKSARWETQATQPLQSFLSLADLANAFKQKSNW